MSPALSEPVASQPKPTDLVPRYFDPDVIVTPADNPRYSPAQLEDLVQGIQMHGQLGPGWVCPSADLTTAQRLCLEGNRRLAVCRLLGKQFWAFDLGRFVAEEERIALTFQHNLSRRVMSREEMAERAARFMEITGCTQGEAAKHLNISQPMLSRAFGDQRIPPQFKARADRLAPSIRSLIASLPAELMLKGIEFAEQPDASGKPVTRDQVALFIRQLKSSDSPSDRKVRPVTLFYNNREVTITLRGKDTASTVLEDLKAIAAKLSRNSEIEPEGWPFLFKSGQATPPHNASA